MFKDVLQRALGEGVFALIATRDYQDLYKQPTHPTLAYQGRSVGSAAQLSQFGAIELPTVLVMPD